MHLTAINAPRRLYLQHDRRRRLALIAKKACAARLGDMHACSLDRGHGFDGARKIGFERVHVTIVLGELTRTEGLCIFAATGAGQAFTQQIGARQGNTSLRQRSNFYNQMIRKFFCTA